MKRTCLCQALKIPDTCPDDYKLIPPCNLDFASCQECKEWGSNKFEAVGKRKEKVLALSTLKEKQKGIIAFIRGENKSHTPTLRYGANARDRHFRSRIAPLKGPVEIAVRGCRIALSDEIVNNVFIGKHAHTGVGSNKNGKIGVTVR